MTAAEELATLREGLQDYIYELQQRYRETATSNREAARAINQIADDLGQRFLAPPPLDAAERARYVNRWETGAQGKGVDRG